MAKVYKKAIEFGGDSLRLRDWCKRLGLSENSIRGRLKAGWSIADALTKPLGQKNKKFTVLPCERAGSVSVGKRIVFLEHDGRRQHVIEWAREISLSEKALRLRLKTGWSVEQALTIPRSACGPKQSDAALERVAKFSPRQTEYKCYRCKAVVPESQWDKSTPHGTKNRNCRVCIREIDSIKALAKSERESRAYGKYLRRNRIAVLKDGTLNKQTELAMRASVSECPYCSAAMTDKTLDHMTPIVNGGLHSRSNVVVCCRSCNSRKGHLGFLDWLMVLWSKAT